MKTSASFLLLPLALLSACTMETPKPPNEMGPDYFIREWFDFVSSDFNRATFDAQRGAMAREVLYGLRGRFVIIHMV
jgi:outer membrane biogenesis lipoprotein LolB